jgi:hypothetical protein
MLYELITIGSVFFWILCGLFSVVLLAEIVYEKFAAALATLLVFCVIFFGFTNLSWAYISEHQDRIWMGFGLYFVGALVTSLVKWYFFVSDARDRYEEVKSEFLRAAGHEGEKTIPQDLQVEWNKRLCTVYEGSHKWSCDAVIQISTIIPSAKENKERILGWMAYWPFVVFWSIFHDFLRRVWELIYKFSSKIFQCISLILFRGVADEIKAANEAKIKAMEEKEKAQNAQRGFTKYGS